jgi:hypothetical protein
MSMWLLLVLLLVLLLRVLLVLLLTLLGGPLVAVRQLGQLLLGAGLHITAGEVLVLLAHTRSVCQHIDNQRLIAVTLSTHRASATCFAWHA